MRLGTAYSGDPQGHSYVCFLVGHGSPAAPLEQRDLAENTLRKDPTLLFV